MRCPRDGSDLKATLYEASIEVDKCPSCAGMFLDDGELEAIQKATERDYKAELDKPVDTAHEELLAERNEALPRIECPRCSGPMDRRRYGLGSLTVIDVCEAGCGIWLDAGEISELEKFYERSQGEVKIPLLWRVWAAVRGKMPKKSAQA
jgi:Zn-finger nucleic acid-binding protein